MLVNTKENILMNMDVCKICITFVPKEGLKKFSKTSNNSNLIMLFSFFFLSFFILNL